MSAKAFLIAHGEKLVVAVVAGGCAYLMWGALNDESIRPKENAQRVEDINRRIEDVLRSQDSPVMKEPRPYLDQMLTRVAKPIPVTPTMAWVTAPPDRNKSEGSKTWLYVYELLAPEVKLHDAVGQIEISVQAPTAPASENAARRISAAPERQWERTVPNRVVNTGRHLGVQMMIKIGEGDYKPLVLPGASKDGVLPLAAFAKGPIKITTPEPWQEHSVQASIVASATSYDFDTSAERPTETVVVFSGLMSPSISEDESFLITLSEQVKAKSGKLLDLALKPLASLALPAGVQLQAREHLFLGPQAEASIMATASVRFALVGFSTEPLPEDPSKTRDVARFLFLRRFQQGAEAKWMEKPVELKYGVGDKLGEEKDVQNPFPNGVRTINADLTTPFVVSKLVKDQQRVAYWMIKAKARPAGGKDRDLELSKKEVPTDVVVLKNPDSGKELVLTKLITINPPNLANTVIYPFRVESDNEREDFAKAPSEFRQWGLVPEEPKAHKPNTGPLLDLFRSKQATGAIDAGSYETDTTYYELADGRLVWWDKVTHGLMKYDPKGVEKAGTAIAPGAGSDTPPPGRNPDHPGPAGAPAGGQPVAPLNGGPAVPPAGGAPPHPPAGAPPHQ